MNIPLQSKSLMTISSIAARRCSKTQFAKHASRHQHRPLSNPPKYIGSGHYQEGDRVLVSYKDGYRVKTKLLPALREDGSNTFGASGWTIKHKEIIGKPARRIYVDAVGQRGNAGSIRVTHPSLEDFVALAPRTVTPIYASYSAFITNLLDIHVDPPSSHNDPRTSEQPPLEILEAGTGHGSLTIHLARAISAANPPPPTPGNLPDDKQIEKEWQDWKISRRAVLHTVEFNPSRSQDAEKGIRTFRGGLYWPHIDFHAGDVGQWIRQEAQRRATLDLPHASSAFLDIVCLDMPNVHEQIQHVQHAMRNHAQLLVYVPQITQLAACQQEVERLQLPLKLHQVVELGEGISNGRQWDLRFVKTRAEQKNEKDQSKGATETHAEDEAHQPEIAEADLDESNVLENGQNDNGSKINSNFKFPTMVCRPMVGRLIMGGAFVGLWRKVAKS